MEAEAEAVDGQLEEAEANEKLTAVASLAEREKFGKEGAIHKGGTNCEFK